MKHLLLIALVALAGCTVDNSESLHDETETRVGAYGVTLLPSQDIYVSFDSMVRFYAETMACMGMTAPGPTIQYVSFQDDFNGAYGAPWGGYISTGLVFVNTDSLGLGFQRDADIDQQILKHEYIHHILDLNTGDKDVSHSSIMFARCGQGVNTSN